MTNIGLTLVIFLDRRNAMPYARHTMTTIDPSNYDAMMSIANSDDFGDFSQWPGLVLIRVIRVAEDRF